ncbi:MAG: hypothetical protein HZA29_00525, partial [Candidatus Omnitrophica bacterium]|nr:hypothetical protein [Candidatus Omnitrophota bacterium]
MRQLTDLRYERSGRALEPGEFSRRGGVLEIYPVDFEAPLRVDFEDERIRSIASVNIRTGKSIWQHKIVIILPNRPAARATVASFSADIP